MARCVILKSDCVQWVKNEMHVHLFSSLYHSHVPVQWTRLRVNMYVLHEGVLKSCKDMCTVHSKHFKEI